MHANNKIKIMHWNAQGISTKNAQVELAKFCNDNEIDLILLNETFLNNSHSFKIPGFEIYININNILSIVF